MKDRRFGRKGGHRKVTEQHSQFRTPRQAYPYSYLSLSSSYHGIFFGVHSTPTTLFYESIIHNGPVSLPPNNSFLYFSQHCPLHCSQIRSRITVVCAEVSTFISRMIYNLFCKIVQAFKAQMRQKSTVRKLYQARYH